MSFRQHMNTLRTILVLLFGVPSLLCVGGVVIHGIFWGEVKVVVLAPPETPARLDIGTEISETVPAGDYTILEVAQGEYPTYVEAGGAAMELTLDLSNGFDAFLIVLPEQCMAQVDVTDFFYGGRNDDPHIEARIQGPKVVDYPWSTAGFDPDSLPSSIYDGSSVYMFQQLPCEMLALEDDALMAALGWS